MLTDADIQNTARSTTPHVYYCLSTDTKPAAAANGSMAIEMDTGKIWFFDAENAEWLEWSRA